MKKGIIAYDITNTKYRTKLSKALCAYGERVQFSVFEYEVNDALFESMIINIERIYNEYLKYICLSGDMKDIKRSIRVYLICDNCYKKIKVFDIKQQNRKRGYII